MKSVKIGLLGLGTVGSGVFKVLERNLDEITRRAGCTLEITQAAVKDISKPRPWLREGVSLIDDSLALADNPELDIIVELIGGDTTSREAVLRAIHNGKHVVTANKALIAVHGNEIFSAAAKKGVMVAFEAAVAGGVPIIKAVREGLSANRIESLTGIINGTSNYILTKMRDTQAPFLTVLKEAQALGYAEADPTFDIEGIDAAHKLTILASLAFGIPLQFSSVFTEGISQISLDDIHYAKSFGYQIKHLAFARRQGDRIELRVHPTLVDEKAMLANVDDVMNAVQVDADAVGPTLYYGAGAGAEPTASAVIADLIDVARALTSSPQQRVPYLAFQSNALEKLEIVPREDIETAYYVRLEAADKPGTLADIAKLFGNAGISIEAILQKEPKRGEADVPVILLTQKAIERHMDNAISAIEALDTVKGRVKKIRLERSLS